MKIVIAGGTGQIGALVDRTLSARGCEVLILSRRPPQDARHFEWDGKTCGPWVKALEGAGAVLNLAGRSVDCRYTQKNLAAMMDSRVDSTRVIGEAIQRCERPPKVWLQMSTATIYAHTFGPSHDEAHGVTGGAEPGVPAYWKRSVDIAVAWERTLAEAATPHTRKVALRTAMVMSPGRGGIFDVLLKMVRCGLGGPVGGGAQYVSWIHGQDFVRALEHIIAREHLSGAINICAPGPLPQKAFMAALRRAWGRSIGLPATKWMAEAGAFFLRTDTELLLKSRRVIPGRLIADGFAFDFPNWDDAASELVAHCRRR